MKLLFVALMSCTVLISSAQHIPRKGSLGISFYQQAPDSLLKQLKFEKGAIVKSVLPQTTAAVLGLAANDIILKVNNTLIKKPNDILAISKQLREKEKIALSVLRNGNTVTLNGTVVARPKETDANAQVEYGEFAYKNGYVRTIYKTLKGKKPIGTVYFLQGLPCYSMDNFAPLDKTKQALDAMVERGFAVYRMEKADMGDNVNMAPCETMGFNEELEMYKAGYAHLLSLPNIDKSAIFLFGHSMGGVTAPLLAEKYQPRGVVVYGTVFKPWMDYLFDAVYYQSLYYGADVAELRKTIEQIKPHAYDYFYRNKPIDEICATEEGRFAMQSLLGYNPTTKLAASGRSPLCHKELNEQSLASAWKNTQGDVLAVYGECDIAAIHPDDHIALIDYVNAVRPGKGTFWQAPGTSHVFEEIGTMAEFLNWQKTPQAFNEYAAQHFSAKLFDYVCNWMKKIAETS